MNQTEKLVEALEEMIVLALEYELHGETVDNAKAALESYKDGWVSELDELEKWIKEEAEDFKNSAFSEDRSVGCYLSMCVLGKIQELKSPPQTKTI